MTKQELIKLLEKFDDDVTVGAFWDDCEWEIDGVESAEKYMGTIDKFDILIDCR